MGFFDKFKRQKPGEKSQPAMPVKADAAKSDAKADKKEKAKRGASAREHGGSAYRVIVRPVFTEKSTRLETQRKYTFIVAPGTSKVAVAQAVRDLYGVKPTSVRVITSHGKNVHFGRVSGKEKDEKKAIVTLKKGDAIAVLE